MKVGLVLSGGGGKGAYQVGVLKAIYELGLTKHIYAVSGTSVGALNCALFLQNDLDAAEQMWLSISPDKILSIKSKSISEQLGRSFASIKLLTGYLGLLEGYGVFSRDGLSEMIDESVDLQMISKSAIPFYAACIQVAGLTRTYFQLNGLDEEKIKSILLATSAIPGVFPAERVEGHYYIDGGIPFIGDNVSIAPLYEAGCETIIVVPLERSYVLNRNVFPNTDIFEIIPQEYQGNLITGTLQFSGFHAKRRIGQGYQDTMRILQPFTKMLENEKNFYHTSKEIVERDKRFMKQRNQLHQTFEQNASSFEQKFQKGKWQ